MNKLFPIVLALLFFGCKQNNVEIDALKEEVSQLKKSFSGLKPTTEGKLSKEEKIKPQDEGDEIETIIIPPTEILEQQKPLKSAIPVSEDDELFDLENDIQKYIEVAMQEISQNIIKAEEVDCYYMFENSQINVTLSDGETISYYIANNSIFKDAQPLDIKRSYRLGEYQGLYDFSIVLHCEQYTSLYEDIHSYHDAYEVTISALIQSNINSDYSKILEVSQLFKVGDWQKILGAYIYEGKKYPADYDYRPIFHLKEDGTIDVGEDTPRGNWEINNRKICIQGSELLFLEKMEQMGIDGRDECLDYEITEDGTIILNSDIEKFRKIIPTMVLFVSTLDAPPRAIVDYMGSVYKVELNSVIADYKIIEMNEKYLLAQNIKMQNIVDTIKMGK